jgi:hypothetical protein
VDLVAANKVAEAVRARGELHADTVCGGSKFWPGN